MRRMLCCLALAAIAAQGAFSQVWIVKEDGSVARRGPSGWVAMPGKATDISVGANGAVWMIGNDPGPGGFGIYRWTGSAWQKAEGYAVRIDVGPDGMPWVVTAGGDMARMVGGKWESLSGRASDIGVGANGDVWIVGTESGPGGYRIYQYVDSYWYPVTRYALRIDVGPDGAPWLVDADGAVSCRMKGKWTSLPGKGSDISVGASAAWKLGTDSGPGGYGIYKLVDGAWQRLAGFAVAVAEQ